MSESSEYKGPKITRQAVVSTADRSKTYSIWDNGKVSESTTSYVVGKDGGSVAMPGYPKDLTVEEVALLKQRKDLNWVDTNSPKFQKIEKKIDELLKK